MVGSFISAPCFKFEHKHGLEAILHMDINKLKIFW